MMLGLEIFVFCPSMFSTLVAASTVIPTALYAQDAKENQ
jgi:hypothetical protein